MSQTSHGKGPPQPSRLPSRQEGEDEFWAAAAQSLRHYEETGLHLTQQEVEDWMARRVRGERVPPPRLHR